MMTKDMIVRAWKDPAFRASLSAEQLAHLPPNPSGATMNELNETELREVVGGYSSEQQISHPWSCGYFCTYTTECGC